MGTTYHVLIASKLNTISQSQLSDAISQQLKKINQQMSPWQKDSELSQINRAKKKQWLTVSAPLFYVLNLANQISQITQGTFDITVAPYVNLWGFGPDGIKLSPPNKKEEQAVNKKINYQALKLNSKNQSIYKTEDLSLDLSAIAKGYAVDQIANYLENLNISNYLVEIGGEIHSKGQKSAQTPWHIAIEAPPQGNKTGTRQIQRILTLPQGGSSIASSGNYRNFFKSNGQLYSHTIDPKTARPVINQLIAATVIAKDTATADALATAMMVMGSKKALAFAEQHKLALLLLKHEKGKLKEYRSQYFYK